ncbi:MAG: PEGA domain-containing protein [Brevundimonas sp.]|uniref:PEGA domain-containing protein n=1 Tax=Brevundimonas sp. TaxID=1871086 RepID=UPI001A185B0F|nr:PEGA domain-containing protein [Brevundimonas sp.]MBJ7447184.1 PEGA domain-containing protein [Brevundimonas sp.]
MTSRTFTRFGVRAVALAAVAITLPACATITRGSSQDFTVESTPPGARVSTSNGFQCDSTPCTFRMPRKNGFRVTVSREGYVSQEVEVTSGVSGGGAAGMAGNVVFGGVIGAVVDGTSGAMKDLSPNPLVVVLLTPAEQRAADAERARAAAAQPAPTAGN